MQYDVHVNPVPPARRAYPYVAVLQSDFAEMSRDRIVAFLAPRAAMNEVTGRLMPLVEIEGRPFVLLLPSLTNLPGGELGRAVTSLARWRERIVEALDWLFLGV